MSNNRINDHEFWMRKALHEAERAMQNGEIPVATILVAGGVEVTRAQTQVFRQKSIVAHGEYSALLQAGGQVWTVERPLIIYSTLEPCLMCLGAAMQAGVDQIVFGMYATPDGGTRYVNDILRAGQRPPEIISQCLELESVALMRKLLLENPQQPAIPYVKEMLLKY